MLRSRRRERATQRLGRIAFVAAALFLGGTVGLAAAGGDPEAAHAKSIDPALKQECIDAALVPPTNVRMVLNHAGTKKQTAKVRGLIGAMPAGCEPVEINRAIDFRYQFKMSSHGWKNMEKWSGGFFIQTEGVYKDHNLKYPGVFETNPHFLDPCLPGRRSRSVRGFIIMRATGYPDNSHEYAIEFFGPRAVRVNNHC